MTEEVLNNSAEARTPTGELKDQAIAPLTESTTTSTTEPKTPVEPKAEPKIEPKPAAPEKYADFKLPDGVKLEGEALTKATELFKGIGLTQEHAQSLVDYHAGALKDAVGAAEKAINDMHTEWKTKSESDPDIGPIDGAKAKQIKENVGRALDALGDTAMKGEFQQVMNLTGVGDHPAFIKVFNKLAGMIIEPRGVAATTPTKESQAAPGTTTRPSVAQGLYPNLPA